MFFDIDTIKINLRPVKLITESNRNFIKIIKKMGNNNNKKMDNNYYNKMSNNYYNKTEHFNNYDKIDKIYNFVYTNLKKINVKKSIEEFESDTESENDDDYVSDLEY